MFSEELSMSALLLGRSGTFRRRLRWQILLADDSVKSIGDQLRMWLDHALPAGCFHDLRSMTTAQTYSTSLNEHYKFVNKRWQKAHHRLASYSCSVTLKCGLNVTQGRWKWYHRCVFPSLQTYLFTVPDWLNCDCTELLLYFFILLLFHSNSTL